MGAQTVFAAVMVWLATLLRIKPRKKTGHCYMVDLKTGMWVPAKFDNNMECLIVWNENQQKLFLFTPQCALCIPMPKIPFHEVAHLFLVGGKYAEGWATTEPPAPYSRHTLMWNKYLPHMLTIKYGNEQWSRFSIPVQLQHNMLPQKETA